MTAVEQSRSPGLVLTMHVEIGADRDPWRLIYAVPDEDLVQLNGYSFVVTVRANIEEWWDTRGADDALDSIEAHHLV